MYKIYSTLNNVEKSDFKVIGDKIINDISLTTGKFISKVKIEFPKNIKADIIDILDEMNYSKYGDINSIEFMFCTEMGSCNGYCQWFDATIIDKIDGHKSYIDNFDRIVVNYFGSNYNYVSSLVENAIIRKFGKDAYIKSFCIENQIECICEIAENILDKDTNKERYIKLFYDNKNNCLNNVPTYSINISLNDDNTFELIVTKHMPNIDDETYTFEDINGIDNLRCVLTNIQENKLTNKYEGV